MEKKSAKILIYSQLIRMFINNNQGKNRHSANNTETLVKYDNFMTF